MRHKGRSRLDGICRRQRGQPRMEREVDQGGGARVHGVRRLPRLEQGDDAQPHCGGHCLPAGMDQVGEASGVEELYRICPLHRPVLEKQEDQRHQGGQTMGKARDGTLAPPRFRPQGIGSGTGALVLRPLRVESGSRHCHTLCDGGLIYAGYDTRRLHGGGQSERLPTAYHGRHTEEAGQVPANRGHQSALGAWLRLLRPLAEGRPRHASRTGAAAGIREGYVRKRRRA